MINEGSEELINERGNGEFIYKTRTTVVCRSVNPVSPTALDLWRGEAPVLNYEQKGGCGSGIDIEIARNHHFVRYKVS